MKISTKLAVFLVAILFLFVAQATFLLQQSQSVTAGYDQVLNQPVREIAFARVVQVTFKKQVQEWKDILLRGRAPEDLAKYTRQFHERESDVRAGAQSLALQLQHDPASRDLINQFLAAHSAMGEKYQAAYEAFVASKFDSAVADKMVRGQDRAPTDLFDQVVARLDSNVKTSVETQRAAVHAARQRALAVFGALLVVLVIAGFLTVANILARLRKLKAVADRLAAADVEGLSIDISGNDEVGVFGKSLKGVHAAINELTTLATAATR